MVWFAVARAAPDLETGDDAPPAPGASLVLLYAGEHGGELGPCGCEGWPRGGLGALATAAGVVRAEGAPTLVLNPGGWLSAEATFGELSEAAIARNLVFHRALYEFGFDAANVGWRELPSVALGPHPGLVSATHRAPELPVARYKRFELGGLDVAVTGVSRDGLPYLRPPGTAIVDPVEAVRSLVATVDADVWVVLAYEVERDVPAIARLPGVDVVIDAADHPERWPPEAVGDAVWVRSTAQGKAMGELRLWIERGAIVRAVERQVPLGPDVVPDPSVERIRLGR